MRYALLICVDEKFFAGLDEEENSAILARYGQWMEEMNERGVLQGGEVGERDGGRGMLFAELLQQQFDRFVVQWPGPVGVAESLPQAAEVVAGNRILNAIALFLPDRCCFL